SQLLGWIEQSCPLEIKNNFSIPLHTMIEGSASNLFRIIHYPPIVDTIEENALRAAAHEDINLITVLLAGSEPGLQAQDLNGNWHDISCDKNTIVVNSGDMLKLASNNYYPSTTHRVINPDPSSNVSRYSMPLFLHPRDEVVLNSEHTAGTYLNERLTEIGLK
ncbi:MAG: 2OG-Fe(II) oxygenase family protein, partial [Candidatus Neomarinimicrobiota bacterium]|nr:2OG-Fe(II) oxygenase family protein [Candidatus Neomarinimicrobiota bacterium]